MAKIKVSPRAGALSELLKKKGITLTDAFEKTRVDRKTLSKIDRGEEVKRETLQQVANKLQVPEGHFSHPVPAPADDSEVSSVLEPGTIMMRKLDWARLEELLKGAKNLRWSLNAQVRDEATRTLLEDFEQAVENFRKQLDLNVPHAWDGDPTLRFQLNRLKASDDSLSGWRHLPIMESRYLEAITCSGNAHRKSAAMDPISHGNNSPTILPMSSYFRSNRSEHRRGEGTSCLENCLQSSPSWTRRSL
jgi:transcriptional regulator with XRE-family HTH domain